jgi:hypothetical protein
VRLSLVALGALALAFAGCSTEDPYTGRPYVTNHDKAILVRRPSPTREELQNRPAPAYEDILREQDAKQQRLEIDKDVRYDTKYLEEGGRETKRAVGPPFGPAHDPWASYEADRRRVLVREWADTGKPEAPAVEPKKEKPIDDDPYAPAPKIGKKDAAAEGDKPAEGEGEKKGDEGEKKADEKKGE